MSDFCQNKTSPYDIRNEDKPLIKAAIGFADWLAARPDVTAAQIKAINEMRLFLQRLPAPPPPHLHGEFGFESHADDASLDHGHLGCWTVSVCRAMLEIFYIINEESDGFSWELCPGHVNRNDLANANDWIEQVSSPEKLLPAGQHIVIQASTWSVVD